MSRAPAAGPGRTALFPRWVLMLSAAIALSTVIPHLHQAATPPPDMVFTGFVEAIDDHDLYATWVEQMGRGRLLVADYQTAEEAPPFLPSPPWLMMGLIARVLPLPTPVSYHAVRLLWGFGYLLILWLLVREFIAQPLARAFAFVAAALGSGFGVVVDAVNVLAGRPVLLSADLMPELWSFHSLFAPHFILATALIALLALIALRAYRRPARSLSVAAFATMALLALTHPYDVGFLVPLLAGHFVYCRIARPDGWRGATVNLWALAGIAPPAAFLWWQMRTNPIVAAWGEQNVLRSPPPLAYLLGFGAVLALAGWGRIVLGRLRRETAGDWLILFWPLVTAIAVYSYPVLPFERRCVEGVHLPLALLAGIALGHGIVPALRRRLAGWSARGVAALVMGLLLAAILPTNIKLVADGAMTREALVPRGWVEGFAWVADNTPEDARLFTSHRTGVFLARYALRHVHHGHWNVTVHVERKRVMADRFFAPDTPDAERLAILRAAGCGWVAADAHQAAAIAGTEGLELAHDAGDLVILRFPKDPPPPPLE